MYCVECARRRGDNANRYVSRRIRVMVFVMSLPIRAAAYVSQTLDERSRRRTTDVTISGSKVVGNDE